MDDATSPPEVKRQGQNMRSKSSGSRDASDMVASKPSLGRGRVGRERRVRELLREISARGKRMRAVATHNNPRPPHVPTC